MELGAILSVYSVHAKRDGIIARLHTGDPSVYGAIQEQIDFCTASGIPWEVVPGVSSVGAAAAAVGREFTLPGISQTLVVTRLAGRTPVPEGEDLAALAAAGASMAILLSVQQIDRVCEKLSAGYAPETPVAVVYRASWPDEQVVRGTLASIASAVKEAGITRQAVVLVGKAMDAGPDEYSRSKLYDASFSHGYRPSANEEASP
jgi:precorrin-4/cobalt-precorrin-4 C11-methyltransferase